MNCSVHYLTLKQTGYVETNTGVTFYHDKTHFDQQNNNNNSYSAYAEILNTSQGRSFLLHNKKIAIPSKMTRIKDQVRELDTLLATNNFNSTNQKLNATDNVDISRLNYHLNSPHTKTIWVSPCLILFIMQDAHLIWLYIDPISCELVKVLIDKSLVGSTSIFKLSGQFICDALLLFRRGKKGLPNSIQNSPALLLLYSDKSRLDIIRFAKADAFNDYLNNNEGKVEKIHTFEPNIATLDFCCPSTYRIEKRITYSSNSTLDSISYSPTFTIWWPNDGQIVWTPVQASNLNSLEKDDLNTNVIVIGMKDNLFQIEQQFKSSGQLLSTNYIDNNSTIIGVEQYESNAQQFSINVFKYEIQSSSTAGMAPNKDKYIKSKVTSFNITTKLSNMHQLACTRKNIIMMTVDQTFILFDIQRNLVRKFKLNIENQILNFTNIGWLLDDLIFYVYDTNGRIKFFDLAFNEIDISYLQRDQRPFSSLNENLTQNILENNLFLNIVSSRDIFSDSVNLFFYYLKGPIGLFHLYMPSSFNEVSLISFHLKNALNKADETVLYVAKSVALLNALDWDSKSQICFFCFTKILNFLLSEEVQYNLQIQTLIERAFGSFYLPQRALKEKTKNEYEPLIVPYARRFFYKLLRYESYDKALLLAVDINSKDLFSDLYYCALDKKETQLAEICRKKFKDLTFKENEESNKDTKTVSERSSDDEFTSNSEFSVSSSDGYDDDACSDDSYYSSLDEDSILSSDKSRANVIKIYDEKAIKTVNKSIIDENEGFLHTKTQAFTITYKL